MFEKFIPIKVYEFFPESEFCWFFLIVDDDEFMNSAPIWGIWWRATIYHEGKNISQKVKSFNKLE